MNQDSVVIKQGGSTGAFMPCDNIKGTISKYAGQIGTVSGGDYRSCRLIYTSAASHFRFPLNYTTDFRSNCRFPLPLPIFTTDCTDSCRFPLPVPPPIYTTDCATHPASRFLCHFRCRFTQLITQGFPLPLPASGADLHN